MGKDKVMGPDRWVEICVVEPLLLARWGHSPCMCAVQDNTVNIAQVSPARRRNKAKRRRLPRPIQLPMKSW